MSEITPAQRHVLRHALGLNRSENAYRNRFVTGPGTDDWPHCQALVESGHMAMRPASEITGGDPCFFVTEKGREEALRDVQV